MRRSSKEVAMPQQPQRPSPRAPLHNPKTSSSDSSGARTTRRSSPNPESTRRRSPRTPFKRKKMGTKASDLEAKLGRAQEELRKIKEQLVSAESAKNDVQDELAEAKKKLPAPMAATTGDQVDLDQKNSGEPDNDEPPPEEPGLHVEEDEGTVNLAEEKVAEEEHRAKLEEEGELERCWTENASLKKQLMEAEKRAVAAENRAEETAQQLSRSGEELAEAKLKASQLQERLESVEWARASLEAEMKKTKVQADQWRKAAEEAAAVLAPTGAAAWPRATAWPAAMGYEVGDGVFTSLWSPLATVEMDMARVEKKTGGIRMFGDLWKKKGPQRF
ncbi:unnamed protein product [Spirodela intermedia]|uniref:Uncharacterized protein n=1 Tax=Spirodela intermedia TaxID=51605 RepID=A0A7I8JPI9_SPIIN|nr:unnamed protein product [Spirodela intermedia]CAA6671473.1 unnamed protein product [Spirodela intermedia]